MLFMTVWFVLTDRQSPINIMTADVAQNSTLTPLDFSSSWNEATSNGLFKNIGQTVKFLIDSTSPNVTTGMPVGVYKFLQVHFHWGNRNGVVGSEHLINGQQSELEVHFVHARDEDRDGNRDPGSALAVVSVLADIYTRPISGVWATLNTSRVTNFTDNLIVSELNLSNLLPTNRDYYYYEGSLTTPLCDETVQWFVLKNHISVPAAYLEALRSVRDITGEVLDYNYRQVQPLEGRIVQTPGSSATVSSSSSLMALTVLALLAMAV